jgi:hypothetical protein
MIPAGEFVALFTAALLTLGLLAGLTSGTKIGLISSATARSGAAARIAMMGSHTDARASNRSVRFQLSLNEQVDLFGAAVRPLITVTKVDGRRVRFGPFLRRLLGKKTGYGRRRDGSGSRV